MDLTPVKRAREALERQASRRQRQVEMTTMMNQMPLPRLVLEGSSTPAIAPLKIPRRMHLRTEQQRREWQGRLRSLSSLFSSRRNTMKWGAGGTGAPAPVGLAVRDDGKTNVCPPAEVGGISGKALALLRSLVGLVELNCHLDGYLKHTTNPIQCPKKSMYVVDSATVIYSCCLFVSILPMVRLVSLSAAIAPRQSSLHPTDGRDE